jgi:peptidoglycan/xylan/chitin deacetylase (PgdA/CDA1 family)
MTRNFIFYFLRTLGALRVVRNINKDKITILCFHRVSDDISYAWPPLHPVIFEKLLNYLRTHYEVIPLQNINDPAKTTKPLLAITFDDGYYDFIENALPILVKYNLPATHFVVTDCLEKGMHIWTFRLNSIIDFCAIHHKKLDIKILDKEYQYSPTPKNSEGIAIELFKKLIAVKYDDRVLLLEEWEKIYGTNVYDTKMMGWEDISICLNNNITIGSHTVKHKALPNLKSEEDIYIELHESKLVLENKLGIPIDIIAFPNGDFDERVVKHSLAAGYATMLSTENNLYVANSKPKYPIPRLLIQHESFIENCFRVSNIHNPFHN